MQADSQDWKSTINDDDINTGTFFSIWYEHLINKTSGHVITVESSYYNLNALNSTTYTEYTGNIISQNKLEPNIKEFTIKPDYILPLSKSTIFNSGLYSR